MNYSEIREERWLEYWKAMHKCKRSLREGQVCLWRWAWSQTRSGSVLALSSLAVWFDQITQPLQTLSHYL